MNEKNRMVIFQSADGSIQIDVKMEQETVWLSLDQMAELFDKNKSTISRHIKNVFEEGELQTDSTVANFATVQQEGGRSVERDITYYNLDVIISVGYRVKSQRGTQFRIWATKVIKDYMVKGYAINEKRINEVQTKYDELKDVVKVLGRTIIQQEKLSNDQQQGLLKVITDYVYALDTLDKYDYQQLIVEYTSGSGYFHATYENAMEAILNLKEKFGASDLFANEKDDSFKSSIGQIYQTFGGVELYPSVEEKAAMLLYLVVKNHSFSDGNKRIAAMLFLWFLSKNGILYAEDGHKRIADNTLVALTLMIAESRTDEMEVMVKVVVNLINRNNQ
ncbi:MAG: virulence protein RhuM/Fic/DOC family protein [Paludibacteraceae bacterium]|nr:virulence protein RhuM/Fic/DOC family protein [Paludibacteraceae bacterium]